jgi:hypothetical protein
MLNPDLNPSHPIAGYANSTHDEKHRDEGRKNDGEDWRGNFRRQV